MKLEDYKRIWNCFPVYVTHDQAEAILALADKIVMKEWKNRAEAGSPTEIYQKPISDLLPNSLVEQIY